MRVSSYNNSIRSIEASPKNDITVNESILSRNRLNNSLYTDTEASIRKTLSYRTRFGEKPINQIEPRKAGFASQLRPRINPKLLMQVGRSKGSSIESRSSTGRTVEVPITKLPSHRHEALLIENMQQNLNDLHMLHLSDRDPASLNFYKAAMIG